ncbi:MAG: hypothetical protein EXS35_03365 [Pedosphaera sp.]|nr:hypothetical protein [Pedosphaera sp.]
MIKKILDHNESVGFTWDNLTALNNYFRKQGDSLQRLPILETAGVLEVLVEAEKLVFMYGAKGRRREQRTDLSWWDHESFSQIQVGAARLGRNQMSSNAPVLWHNPATLKAIQGENWFQVIAEDQASVVSIGSPLAALSSEIMLARMFGVEPFVPPHVTSVRPLPFFFVWRPDLAGNFRSAFGLTWRDLEADYPELAKRNKFNKSSAFVLDGKAHESPTRATEWTMHGIIAAQRRAAGNVWLVVSGLAGPATFGTATMVKKLAEELPWSSGSASKVLWVPVKVKIEAGKARSDDEGDIRQVKGSEFDGPPRMWPEPVAR